MNLYYHKSDFGVNSKWMFFAISHKKKPWDGVGGTAKRSKIIFCMQ